VTKDQRLPSFGNDGNLVKFVSLNDERNDEDIEDLDEEILETNFNEDSQPKVSASEYFAQNEHNEEEEEQSPELGNQNVHKFDINESRKKLIEKAEEEVSFHLT
jgi:hypothetical protein